MLGDAGFIGIEIEPTRVYTGEDAAVFLAGAGLDTALASEIDGRIMGAFVRATKPKMTMMATEAPAKSCCGPDCCA